MNPAMPIAYVGGSLNVTASTVQNLLALIQAQLAPNCPPTAVQLQLVSDSGNTAPIYVGQQNKAGPLSATNYAYALPQTNAIPRVYQSSYPGNQAPIGELQLFTTAAGVLHVELFT